jgi:hypothetical protein
VLESVIRHRENFKQAQQQQNLPYTAVLTYGKFKQAPELQNLPIEPKPRGGKLRVHTLSLDRTSPPGDGG